MAVDPQPSAGACAPAAARAPHAAAEPAQVAEVNRAGLRVVRQQAAAAQAAAAQAPAAQAPAGQARLPAAVQRLCADWAALDDASLARVAAAPFLLFHIDVAAATGFAGAQPGCTGTGGRADGEAGNMLLAGPAGRAFARMAVHYAWHVSAAAPVAAPLALGLCAEACAQLRDLGLEQVDAMAEGGSSWVQLRWADDAQAWAARLAAARRNDAAGLWSSTLAGLQRLAGAMSGPGAASGAGGQGVVTPGSIRIPRAAG